MGKVNQLDTILNLFEDKNSNKDLLLSEIGNVKELLKDKSKETASNIASEVIDDTINKSINIK